MFNTKIQNTAMNTQIPLIEMKILEQGKVVTKDISFDKACEQVELGKVDLDSVGYNYYGFDVDLYMAKLRESKWATAWLTLHMGLNGTYSENKYGHISCEQEDAAWFDGMIIEQLNNNISNENRIQ